MSDKWITQMFQINLADTPFKIQRRKKKEEVPNAQIVGMAIVGWERSNLTTHQVAFPGQRFGGQMTAGVGRADKR